MYSYAWEANQESQIPDPMNCAKRVLRDQIPWEELTSKSNIDQMARCSANGRMGESHARLCGGSQRNSAGRKHVKLRMTEWLKTTRLSRQTCPIFLHSRRATWRWGRSRTIAIADELMVSSRRCEAAWKQHEKPRWRSDGTIQMHGFDMVWPTDLGHVIAHVTCVSIDSQASKIKNGWISLETPTDFEADFLTHRYVALETTHFQAW